MFFSIVAGVIQHQWEKSNIYSPSKLYKFTVTINNNDVFILKPSPQSRKRRITFNYYINGTILPVP